MKRIGGARVALCVVVGVFGLLSCLPAAGYSSGQAVGESRAQDRADAPTGRESGQLHGKLGRNTRGNFIRLTDDFTCDTLVFNADTGFYEFLKCNLPFTLEGTGSVRTVGSITMLTDKSKSRSVSAGFLTNQRTGSATIMYSQFPGIWQVFRINDTVNRVDCPCAFN
jgi:hypothetical protein